MSTFDVLIETSRACSVHIYDPHLAAAWIKALIGEFTPDDYLRLFKLLYPLNGDALNNARYWVELCFGTGT